MPLYTFKNNDTGEEFTSFMKYEELEEFLLKNKSITQVFKSFGIVAGTGTPKIDDGFRDILKGISSQAPNNKIDIF